MKISDFSYIGRFLFRTEALGSILCHYYTASVEAEVRRWLAENIEADAEQLVRFLITKLCVVSENLKDPSEVRISSEQSLWLTKDELESFCINLISHNRQIIQQVKVNKYKSAVGEERRFTIDFKRLVTDEQKRVGVKDNCSYLLYMLKDYHKNHHRQMLDKFKSMSGSFSVTTRNLFEENMLLSDKIHKGALGSPRYSDEIASLPQIPTNPVYETNRSINLLANEMRAVSLLVDNMNELGIRMNLDSASNAKKAQRWNNLMFLLGISTLVITAVFSYQGLRSANQSSMTLESLMERQNALLISQGETQKNLLESLPSLLKAAQISLGQSNADAEQEQPSEKTMGNEQKDPTLTSGS
ncbi:hypothetical protein WG68_00415 [Arsukibacterium ikkense]|uniref:Uncharacterized protein n=1 Tax=Arsukibacterium ikkense TaxID=336831 RepID=A0A0M2V9Q1_9GAMM|nr:hypothetical protein [Arsukibacterium ikkense]KKO47154.1 hypothetical protein WG68_00415 [Arsukibacterium ikkense]